MEIASSRHRQLKTNRKKNNTPEAKLQHELAACSRKNDLSGALALYETAVSENTRLTSYHFNTLLHICSSSLEALEVDHRKPSPAVEAAFRIFEHMVASGIHPAEATITSMARIAAAKDADGGDLAFDLVRNMRTKYGVSPKLRTYGPALFAFCQKSDCADKAYAVEEHMVSTGVQPEVEEIAALLKVSSEAQREDRVYMYLHKLKKCVGRVGPSTAEIVERWFGSECASKVGRESWDLDRIKDVILRNGGGCHGEGWLGKGNWRVHRTNISSEGRCLKCGEQLASVDIDCIETEKFAELVASLAMERETKSNFRDFQEWINNHADYETIVDGANVAFYQQNFADGGFSLPQLKTVVCELFQRSKRIWPLVIMHNKRVLTLMENPSNRQLLEDWRANGALYSTPNGSNDDWYWLYAAVKLKCLLVTNDEMRDHIFELLNRSIFSKWKERHQVRYTFVKGEFRLEMPPQYSVVMQESEWGSWHVPVDDKCQDDRPRVWLCITRHRLHETSDEVTQTGASLLKTQTSGSSLDSWTNCLSPFQLCNGNATRITGKRKDRYLSPSSPLDQ